MIKSLVSGQKTPDCVCEQDLNFNEEDRTWSGNHQLRGYLKDYAGALARLRLDIQAAAHQMHPVLNVSQTTQAILLVEHIGLESNTIIADNDLNIPFSFSQGESGMLGVCMFDNVE